MDIGEHPGCNRGNIYILSNADSVKMYKNDRFIKEYLPGMSPYKHLKHGPILIDDFIGDSFAQNERFRKKHAKEITDAMNLVAQRKPEPHSEEIISYSFKTASDLSYRFCRSDQAVYEVHR